MLRKLFRQLGEYKKMMLLTPLLVVCEVVLEVLIPFLMAGIVDVGIEGQNLPYIMRMGVLMAVMAFTSMTLGVLAGIFSAKGGAGFAKNIRSAMYNKIQSYSFENIDKFSSASLLTRLTTDVMFVQEAAQLSVRLLFRAPTMMIFSTVMAVVLQPQLSLVFLAAIPFVAVGMVLVMFLAYPVFVKRIGKYDKMNRIIQENLSGIKVVKSFAQEENEYKKFLSSAEDLIRISKKAEKRVVFMYPIMQIGIFGTVAAILWFGGNMVIAGGMTTGEMTVFLSYVLQTLMSLMMLSMVTVMILVSRASAGRIMEVLDEKSAIQNPENPVYEVADGSVEFIKASFAFGDKKVLSNINLKIEHGQTIGIIGGTGSGKSSLVQLIPRLYDACEGQIKVGGRNVKEYDLKSLRDNVAMVLQNNVLFSGTIEENLRWGNPDATEEEIIEAAKTACAHEFVSGFSDGYKTVLDRGGKNLSGGQRQRLCIARALLKKPKVLILDDSTSAVDTKTEAKLRHGLKNLTHLTKIFISQRIISVQDADQIVVISHGQIEAVGTHEQLLQTNETYKDIYTIQSAGGQV